MELLTVSEFVLLMSCSGPSIGQKLGDSLRNLYRWVEIQHSVCRHKY